MDFAFTDEQQLLRSTVRALLDKHAPPEAVRALDRASAYPDELYRRWVEAGLLALPFPETYGGLGGSVIDLAIVIEEISRTSADLVMAFAGSIFCGLNILRVGSEEQKRHWLPRIVDGRTRMAIGISEPDAGSDAGAMRTFAERDGDGYVVNGQKLWVTGAGAPDATISLYVKTDRAAHYRDAMALLLVDNDTPGLQMRKLDMLGRRCTGTYELFLDAVRVPGDRLVGGERGGWAALMSGLQVERVCSAIGAAGAASAAFDLALAYAKERVQFGRPIAANQAIAHRLADLATAVEAARTLAWRAAWAVDAGHDALREITMAKLLASETYVRVANEGMQIFGAYGYNMEYDMQRHYRDARAATIAAGSSEMQRNIIAGLLGAKVRG